MKKVFVTGANGCVGHYVIDELLNNPEYELYLLVRTPDKLRADLRNSPKIKIITGDLASVPKHAVLLQQMDYVIHLAAQWGGNEVNDEQSLAFLGMFDPQKCQRVIYFSTASILGENNQTIPEAKTLGTHYIRGKYLFHQGLSKLKIYPKVITLFPTWVFGGDSRHPYSHATEGLREGHKWVWLLRFFTVDASFHFIHAADMAKITKYLLENEVTEKEFVLGNPLITAKELIKQVCAYYKTKVLFQLPISLPLVLFLARILNKKIQPWDRFCLEKRHFRHKTVNPASFGMSSNLSTVPEILRQIGK